MGDECGNCGINLTLFSFFHGTTFKEERAVRKEMKVTKEQDPINRLNHELTILDALLLAEIKETKVE